VVDHAARPQVPEEVHRLFDGDSVSDTNVDATTFFERATAVDADQFAFCVEERSSGIPWVDSGIGLDAVAVFEDGAGGVLVSMDTADQAVGYSWLQVCREHEWVAGGEAPLPDTYRVAISDGSDREVIASDHFQNSQIARRIDSCDDSFIHLPVVESASHARAERARDMEVCKYVSVRGDADARTAPLAIDAEDADGTSRCPFHRFDSFFLSCKDFGAWAWADGRFLGMRMRS